MSKKSSLGTFFFEIFTMEKIVNQLQLFKEKVLFLDLMYGDFSNNRKVCLNARKIAPYFLRYKIRTLVFKRLKKPL